MTSEQDPTHGPDYRPENVKIVQLTDGYYAGRYCVADYDGALIGRTETRREDCLPYLKVRRGVIKAALTRRANKARKAAGR